MKLRFLEKAIYKVYSRTICQIYLLFYALCLGLACVSFTILRSVMISSFLQNYILFSVSKLDTRDRKNLFIIVYNIIQLGFRTKLNIINTSNAINNMGYMVLGSYLCICISKCVS